MKVVYIDVLITVNIFIDYMLILCTKKVLNINTSYKRILFASLIGGVFSLVALLPSFSFLLNFLYDLLGACILIFIAFKKCTLKQYIKRVLVYFSLSFSFCGAMIFILSVFKPKNMQIYNDVVYFNISPILLILLTLVCYYILKFIKRMTNNVKNIQVCNVVIKTNNLQFSFVAKIDTGCNVKEPFSNFNVIVAEKSLFNNIVLTKENMRLIPFTSLGGTGTIYGFRPDKIEIDNIEMNNEVYIGLCKNILTGDVKALIPAELINNIK